MKNLWKLNMIAAVVAMVILFGINAAVAEQTLVTVQRVDGVVEARTSAGAEWTEVAAGGKLSVGATVRTGPSSSCLLLWGNGHVLKIQALTTLDISRLERDSNGNENSGFVIAKGNINAHVGKLRSVESSFTIRTPTAVAGVRGTDLFVDVSADRISTFGVTAGEIYVEAGGVETIVMPDFIVTVDSTGVVGGAVPMPIEMKQKAHEQAQEVKNESHGGKTLEKGKEERKRGRGAQGKGKGAEHGKGIMKHDKKSAGENGEAVGKPKSGTVTGTGTEMRESTDKDITVIEEPVDVEADATEMDVTDAADAAVDTINDDVMDEQLTNDIVEMSLEDYKTGQFELDVYVEP